MPTKKNQMSVSVTPRFYAAIEAYRVERGIKSWSQALLELATIGYSSVYSMPAPDAHARWGGDRKSEDYQLSLERAEVALLGLPPLAEDD